MNSFNEIINKVTNLDNNIFSIKYDNTDKISGIDKIFFSIMCNESFKSYKNKFHFIEETLNNFYFSIKQNERDGFFNLFCKIQSIYHRLNRLVYLYKYKKSNLIIDTDLQLNKITENEPNVICIYHINSRYLFKIEDLLKIIYTSLTNSFLFFSEPISIKNPYNNVPFGKSILYYIYIYLASNAKITFIKSKYLDIFLKFKECNFDTTMFVNCYEHILREYAIKNHLNNTTKPTLLVEIKSMVDMFNNNFSKQINKITISEEFPEDDLIRIMKPYLYLHLTSCCSLVNKNKIEANKQLHKKLREFQCFNPQFGRKIIRFKNVINNGKFKRVKSHIEFNMKHKKFNTYDIGTFMTNHLSYINEPQEDEDNYEESEDEPELTFTGATQFSQPQLNDVLNEVNDEDDNEVNDEDDYFWNNEEEDDNDSIS